MRGLEPTTAVRFPFRVLFVCFVCVFASVLTAVPRPTGRSAGLAVRVIVAPACSVVVQPATAGAEAPRPPRITCTRGQAAVQTHTTPPPETAVGTSVSTPATTTTLVTIDF